MTKHDYSKEIAAIYQTVYNRKPGETFLAPSSTSPDWSKMDQFPPPVEEVRESIEVTRETLDGQISYLIKRASDMYVEEENLSEEDLEDEGSEAVCLLINAVEILNRTIELMDNRTLLRLEGKSEA